MTPYTITCPFCHGEWEVGPDDDSCHADDKRDGCLTTCEGCGEKYQLTTDIEVYFYADKPE